ncbi:importin-13 [Chelonus insularis]|uniref:importin-13 n=1 Tax=Chelonus insularis TaxID=460826 RepID=UPI00158D7C29|nr:importin-13 [Chelonus insularis]
MNIMDITKTVEEAVKQFYLEGAKDLHEMLLRFQASPEAWSFVWPLLDPSKAWEVQFFAASTLHVKILKQWEEIPESEYPALKNQILVIMTSSSTPKLIQTKLCEALAVFLANHCMSEDYDQELMDDLIEILPYNNLETLDLLLRVLSALLIDAEKRTRAKRVKLKEQLGVSEYKKIDSEITYSKVTWLLQQVLSSCNQLISNNNKYSSLYILALECALSWIKLGPTLDLVAQLFDHFPTAASRYVPQEPGCDDDNKPWEIVQEFVSIAMTNEYLYRRPQLFWSWTRSLVSVAQEKNNVWFARILTTIGDAHTRMLLQAIISDDPNESHKWTVEILIKLILDYTDCPGRYPIDERHSCIPINFWYSLQDTIETFDPPDDNRIKEMLKPIYIRLTHILLRKATLPSTPTEAGTARDRELLRCYRQDIADTFNYCFRILGQDLLVILGQRLTQPLLDTLKWPDVEITLYTIQALSDCIGCQENDYVSALIDLIISHVSYDRYPQEVLACACSTLGTYAEWLGDNPDPWLERSLQLITFGLTQGSMAATRASMALKDITRECQLSLAPLAPSLLDTISKTLTILPSGSGEGLRLMYAAGKLLNSLSSTEEQLKHLDNTLGLCVMRLHELLQHPIASARTAVINQLKMATMFLSTLEGAIGKSVLDRLLPIFNQLVTQAEWNQNDQTLEAMHGCIERSLQCLLHPEQDARPLLSLLVTSYKIRSHPSALNLLKQMVSLFGGYSEVVIGPIFREISAHTLSGFNACRMSGGNLSDFWDLMEAYLGLLSSTCRKNPSLMMQMSDQHPEMFRYGIEGLGFPESDVIKAAGFFIVNVIKFLPSAFIPSIGQELIRMILQCIGGRTERKNLETHAKVLNALKAYSRKDLSIWVQTALEENILPISPDKKAYLTRAIFNNQHYLQIFEYLQQFSIEFQKPPVGL